MIRLIVTLIVGFAIYTFVPTFAPVVRTVAFMGLTWLAYLTFAGVVVTYRACK